MTPLTETHYYFNGILRWNLLWPSPNLAALALASAIPILWQFDVGRGRRPFLWAAAFAVETGLIFCLARTFSRGGLVGLAVAAVYFALWHAWRAGRLGARSPLVFASVPFAARLGAAAACCWISGFAGRLAPAYVESDGAVLHRLELWRGAIKMASTRPILGWGAGESGIMYSDWFQPLGHTWHYLGMVNSYLELAVEHGLLALGFVVALLVGLATLPFDGRVTREGTAAAQGAAAASVVAFGTAAFFSSVNGALSAAAVAAAAALLVAALHFGCEQPAGAPVCRGSRPIGLAALVLVASVWSAGRIMRSADATQIAIDGPYAEIRTNGFRGKGRSVLLYPSVEEFGEDYGRRCREVASGLRPGDRLIVPLFEGRPGAPPPPADLAVFVGGSYLIQSATLAAPGIIVRPSGLPVQPTGGLPSLVVLAPMDFSGVNRAWLTWSGDRGVPVMNAPGGQYHITAEEICGIIDRVL